MKRKKSFNCAAVFTAMVLLTGAAWYSAFGDDGRQDAVFMEYRAQAAEHEEKEAYITAAEYCVKALSIRKDDEMMLRAAEDYLKCGDRNNFLKYCRMAAEKSPDSDRPLLLMTEYWLDYRDYKKADEVINTANGNEFPDEIKKLKNRIKGDFSTGYKTFSDVKGFYSGYCAVSDEKGHWGLADEEGRLEFLMKYDDIGAYNEKEDIIPVCNDGKWYFADSEGRIKYVPDRQYSYLGAYSDGLSPFSADGEYGYMSLDYTEKLEKYDYAGAFSDGVSAVKKAGKWALLDSSLNEITGFVYDDIELDRYGFCVRNGKISAVRDGEKIFLDLSGNEIQNDSASLCGLTPVCSDGLWGFCGDDGEMLIEPQFEEVMDFSENGRACVKKNGLWMILTLELYR